MTVAVAVNIYRQLGGDRFKVMTGASEFIGDNNTLEMKLPKNRSGANRLYITLNADDTYTMCFYKYTPVKFDMETFEIIRESKREIIKTIDGVYADMLREIFEGVTGMYTML